MAVVYEHLAYRAPNPVVGILIETLQHPHNFPLIENRRSIAEHMYGPATNRSIGIVGHLQYPLPDLGNVGFQFAWAERLERFAALAGARTVREFEPVRAIALGSSQDQQVVSFATEAAPAVSRSRLRKPPNRIQCLVPGWQTRAKL